MANPYKETQLWKETQYIINVHNFCFTIIYHINVAVHNTWYV